MIRQAQHKGQMTEECFQFQMFLKMKKLKNGIIQQFEIKSNIPS